jgi:hypothetical protein
MILVAVASAGTDYEVESCLACERRIGLFGRQDGSWNGALELVGNVNVVHPSCPLADAPDSVVAVNQEMMEMLGRIEQYFRGREIDFGEAAEIHDLLFRARSLPGCAAGPWQDSKVCPPPMDQRTILGCWNGSILSCYWDRELGAWMVSGYNIKRNPDYWAELYTPAAPEKEDKG